MSGSLKNITESQLLSGCLKGKPDYQRELFDRFSAKLFAICRRYAKNYDDAKDILQDAFIKIFNHLKDFRQQGSLEGWMRKTVIHTALNHYRNFSFRNEKAGIENRTNTIETDPDVIANLNEQDIVNAISSLPDGYRVVFNLYVVEGYSHKEIADILGIDESTSRSQLHKARNSLKELLLKTKNILLK